MSGVYDYAPLIYNMALGAYFQNDRVTMSLCAGLKVNHRLKFFTNPGHNLPAGVAVDTEYYVYNITNNVDYYLKKVPDNSYMNAGAGTAPNGFIWAAILPVNWGDTVWKPKLTKDQLTRLFPVWGDTFKTPPAANKLEAGFVYDHVTGTFVGDLPEARDIRSGITCGNETRMGNLRLPGNWHIRDGIEYDSTETPRFGIYRPDLPTPEELKLNATCGVGDPGGPVTGTYPGEPLFPPQAVHPHIASVPQRVEAELGNI